MPRSHSGLGTGNFDEIIRLFNEKQELRKGKYDRLLKIVSTIRDISGRYDNLKKFVIEINSDK